VVHNNKTLLLATHNSGKIKEISALLAPLNLIVRSASEYDLPEPLETADSFEGNAALKAIAAARSTDLPALADDSGFCVEALNGAPGIYSARWAGANKDFQQAMQRVYDELLAMKMQTSRASFVCVLAYADPQGHCTTFRGEINGNICWPPRGEKGFGYDPMFIPDGYTQTFAEIDPAVKNAISHRALAFKKFKDDWPIG
jgi:XTP/dITP diphosphohydrolase